MNSLLANKSVNIDSNEIEEFVTYCNDHEVYPSGGAYCTDTTGKITGQYFYL